MIKIIIIIWSTKRYVSEEPLQSRVRSSYSQSISQLIKDVYIYITLCAPEWMDGRMDHGWKNEWMCEWTLTKSARSNARFKGHMRYIGILHTVIPPTELRNLYLMRLKFACPLLTTRRHQRPGWVKGKGNCVRGDGSTRQSSSSDRTDIIVAVSRLQRLTRRYPLPSPVLPYSTLGLHHWQVANRAICSRTALYTGTYFSADNLAEVYQQSVY